MELNEKMNIDGSMPPDHVWGTISNELADGESNRLYNLEFTPPDACWNHIQQHIQQGRSKVVRFSPASFLRYAAIIAFAIFTSLAILSPSFRTSISTAFEGNKIKAALPSTQKFIDSIHQQDQAKDSLPPKK